MTVYVDNARIPYGRMIMCHMMADSHDELIGMARSLGVSARHFHRDHFNVCERNRLRAIRMGAREVTSRDLVVMRRKNKS